MNPIRCVFLVSATLFAGCTATPQDDGRNQESERQQSSPDSTASSAVDFIRVGDNGLFSCLSYEGAFRAEMPDTRRSRLFANGVYTWTARYADGTSVEMWAHPDFGSRSAAFASVEPVAKALGELPTRMRSVLDHVVFHDGNLAGFYEHLGHFFVLYSGQIRALAESRHLEEEVFRLAVISTLYAEYGDSPEWREARKADSRISKPPWGNNNAADMGFSALAAWPVLVHPGRLPPHIEAGVREKTPNRLAFFEKLFERPLFRSTGAAKGC